MCVLGLNLINASLGRGVMRYRDANGIEEGDLMKCATSVRRALDMPAPAYLLCLAKGKQ
jgi:hypothetical protein